MNIRRIQKDSIHQATLALFSPAILLAIQSSTHAGGVPTWNPLEAGVFTHLSGSPTVGESPYQVPLPISSDPPKLLSHTISFSPHSGNSNASAGLQHSESTTTAKIIISSGTGVSQTDPGHAETASSLEVLFNAEWMVPSTSYGAPISGSFSLPIGAKIGANGSASATCVVDWDYIDTSNVEHALRTEYTASQTWQAGASGQTVLTNLTAPTTTLTTKNLGAGEILVLTADIKFTADNDDGPTLIELPTVADFASAGVTSDQTGVFDTNVYHNLFWGVTGAAAVWDNNNTQSFNLNASAAPFNTNDFVFFNDTNAGDYAVTINSVVNPGTISVNNSSGSYTFTGTGSIIGAEQLTKSGTSALTLQTSNAFTGGVLLAGGSLNIGNASALGTGIFNIAAGAIANTTGAPLTLAGNNPVIWSGSFNANGTFSLNLGTGPLAITGTGMTLSMKSPATTLIDSGAVTGSGGLTVQGSGFLSFRGPFNYGSSISVTGGTLNLAPNGVGINLETIGGSLSISGGAKVTVSPQATSNRVLLSAGVVGIAVSSLSTLDLADNDMRLQKQSVLSIVNLIAQGYNGGHWNGTTGIISSSAAADSTHLTALGAIVNSANGAALYGTGTALGLFDGISPGGSDVLVKYTYVGDTNLDGQVDGSDYSRIDAGFLAHSGTWYNGDFNYDNTINGSDYTLIDNAFNQQGANLTSSIADPTANITAQIADASPVPEPSTIGALTIATIGLLKRRRASSTRFPGSSLSCARGFLR